LLVGAPATLERSYVFLLYIDVILLLLVAAPVLAAGAPALGFTVGAVAWILGRGASAAAERRIAALEDFRRQIGYGVASTKHRVWLLACAIIAAGVGASRHDGLTAALVIFGAFSVNFIRNAFEHITQARSTTR
jgi:hypothetical protein